MCRRDGGDRIRIRIRQELSEAGALDAAIKVAGTTTEDGTQLQATILVALMSDGRGDAARATLDACDATGHLAGMLRAAVEGDGRYLDMNWSPAEAATYVAAFCSHAPSCARLAGRGAPALLRDALCANMLPRDAAYHAFRALLAMARRRRRRRPTCCRTR